MTKVGGQRTEVQEGKMKGRSGGTAVTVKTGSDKEFLVVRQKWVGFCNTFRERQHELATDFQSFASKI